MDRAWWLTTSSDEPKNIMQGKHTKRQEWWLEWGDFSGADNSTDTIRGVEFFRRKSSLYKHFIPTEKRGWPGAWMDQRETKKWSEKIIERKKESLNKIPDNHHKRKDYLLLISYNIFPFFYISILLFNYSICIVHIVQWPKTYILYTYVACLYLFNSSFLNFSFIFVLLNEKSCDTFLIRSSSYKPYRISWSMFINWPV